MRSWVLLVDRAERHPVYREVINAVRDGAYWGWLVALVAAVATWIARGMPDPGSAAAAAVLIPLGPALAGWRAWRRTAAAPTADRRAAAQTTARRWLTGYGAAAALIPAGYLLTHHPVAGLITAAVVVGALAELAIVTIPMRARARLLGRLRIGARAVAGDGPRSGSSAEAVQVGRALWQGMTLQRVMITYPAGWSAVHRDTRRDDLAERMMWELCGPPARTPDEAVRRPDYTSAWDHVMCRLVIERVPSLPRLLAARDFGQDDGALVLGQTLADTADAVLDGVPAALYRPRNHALITGGTQHGKSSGVRAWVVDGLTHGVLPGGVWCVDGKGSGNMAPLTGRRGVHDVAHTPDEWRRVITAVAAEVAQRYAEILAWRSGTATRRPHHLRALLCLDEIQQVLMVCPDLAETLDTLARQALEAGVILWVITQRPDAKDAVPGAMRDQLLDRACFGPLSSAGAKMVFDLAGDDWHRAMGVAPVPGRALVWLDGVWRTLQAPWMPIPADDPTVEPLYPPRATQPPPDPTRPARPTGPRSPRPGPATWPPPPPQGDEPAGEDDPAYDPGAARRRRRRT